MRANAPQLPGGGMGAAGIDWCIIPNEIVYSNTDPAIFSPERTFPGRLSQDDSAAIASLQVTSWQPCWGTKTKAFLSAGK